MIHKFTQCAGNTECKVQILLFTDLVTVTKLPTNLSKSTGEKHTCSICGWGYSFQSGLSKHTRSTHNGVESGLVTCTLCNSRFEYLFNSCLLPKSGKSSKTTPTSSIKPSDVYRRKGDKFQYIRRIL